MTARGGVRVTLGGRSWDIDPAAEGMELSLVGPGRAVLRLASGTARHRILWSVRPGSRGAATAAAALDGDMGGTLELIVDGWRFESTVESLERARLRERASRGAASAAPHAPVVIRAPIPGRIASVRVVEGEAVEPGAPLVTLEAMKMENVVRALRAGTIGRVAVAVDQTVELGDTLLELA